MNVDNHHHVSHTHLFPSRHTVPSRAEVIGFLGNNLTLQFTFNSSVNFSEGNHYVIHKVTGTTKKITEFTQGKEGKQFSVHSETKSVSWYKTKLIMNDSGSYVASLVNGRSPAEKSNPVILNVQEPQTSSTGMILSSRNYTRDQH